MTIEQYLSELRRRLPRARRERFLAEAEAHLRDAARSHRARGLDPLAAESAAVEGFGDPALLARRLAAVTALSSLRRSALVATVAVVALVVPLYGIPENTLPPATWEAKPASIAALQGATIALWLAAVGLALAGVGLALARCERAAAWALGAAAAVVAVFLLAGVALFAVWLEEAPSTPVWPFLALALPATLGCLALCAAAGARARTSSRVLGDVQD